MADDLAAWLTQIWDEDEALAKDAALMSGWDGFGESRIASGSEWSASYHVVKRKRADGEPIESRKGRELADCGNLNLERAKHIAANDPASVLARIAADRQILAEHRPSKPPWPTKMERGCRNCATAQAWDPRANEANCLTLRLLASPYADRPGYREEWRPE